MKNEGTIEKSDWQNDTEEETRRKMAKDAKEEMKTNNSSTRTRMGHRESRLTKTLEKNPIPLIFLVPQHKHPTFNSNIDIRMPLLKFQDVVF